MREASQTAFPTAKVHAPASHEHGGRDLVAAERAGSHKRKIGTPLRADLAGSLGRTRTSDLAVTQTPRFPWGTDYLFTMTTYRF
jgi:hypothetical protein